MKLLGERLPAIPPGEDVCVTGAAEDVGVDDDYDAQMVGSELEVEQEVTWEDSPGVCTNLE